MSLLPGRLGEDDGFLDIDLPITRLEVIPGGGCLVIARGMVAGVDMGFAISLGQTWKPKPLEDGSATFYWGSGSYRRTGTESDRFVAFVAARYELLAAASMVQEVNAEVVGLNTDPRHTSSRGASTKFFFHTAEKERYAEVFTNVNVEELLLEFREKDNEYRSTLLRALTET